MIHTFVTQSGSSYAKIASALDKGLQPSDIKNRRHTKLKESSGIVKPPMQAGRHSSITWTAEEDAMIASMNVGGSSYAEIASALGKGLRREDINNRWNSHLNH